MGDYIGDATQYPKWHVSWFWGWPPWRGEMLMVIIIDGLCVQLMLLTNVDVNSVSCFVCVKGLIHDLELKKYGSIVGCVSLLPCFDIHRV